MRSPLPCGPQPAVSSCTRPSPPSPAFFFFKQKTAYEIVSGDWSSDVCSSDLRVMLGPEAEGEENHQRQGQQGDRDSRKREQLQEIGRASCRERVSDTV